MAQYKDFGPTQAAEQLEHELGMIRVKLRAGLIIHPEWPPPDSMPIENQLVHLDRLAREIHSQFRDAKKY